MQVIFWISAALAAYASIGYPALALFAGALVRRTVAIGPCEPPVSILIAARNEAERIAATIANKLALDYPPAKLQIIVVSDASTDGTDARASAAASDRVLVLRQESHRGKTAALDLAMRRASGQIIVFADANSMYATDALRMLVRNFHDPRVGYVTGRMVYRAGSDAGLGCRAYMAYEDLLRRAETALGSIVGVNGGIDAVRRELYAPMRDDQLSDFVLPLHVIRQGRRVVYEPDALLFEDALTTASAEYRMRLRVALRAWWTLAEMRALFDIRRYGLFSVQLLSHKALRYAAFLLWPALAVSAFALRHAGPVYAAAAASLLVLAVLGAAGYVAERTGARIRVLALPYYFLVVNAAAAHALLRFVRGRRQAVWTPRLG